MAPASTNRVAIPRPDPLEAPVTTAIFPSSVPMISRQPQARFLTSVKSSSPWRPHSRPSPDCL